MAVPVDDLSMHRFSISTISESPEGSFEIKDVKFGIQYHNNQWKES